MNGFNFFGSPKRWDVKTQVKCIAFWDIHALCSTVFWVSAQTENTHTVHSIYVAYCRNSMSSMIGCYPNTGFLNQFVDGSLVSVQCCCKEKRMGERVSQVESEKEIFLFFSWIDLKQTFPVRLLLPADWSCSSWQTSRCCPLEVIQLKCMTQRLQIRTARHSPERHVLLQDITKLRYNLIVMIPNSRWCYRKK